MAASMKMSVIEWIEIPDCQRQRDTERRARWAANRHLAKYHKSHDYVYAATLNSQIICKLDGHTRALLWSRGELEPPPSGQVFVLLLEVENKAEAKQLYDELDSASAVKKRSDLVFGATRENGFRLKSSLLSRCQFNTQLCLASTGTFSGDTNQMIKEWKQELLDLDSLDLTCTYPTLIASMLVSIRRDGLQTAAPFWEKLDRDAGEKDSRGSDGVDALHRHMDIRKAEGRTAGYENVKDSQERAWYCYQAWLDGKRVSRIGQAKFMDVIQNLKQKRKVAK